MIFKHFQKFRDKCHAGCYLAALGIGLRFDGQQAGQIIDGLRVENTTRRHPQGSRPRRGRNRADDAIELAVQLGIAERLGAVTASNFGSPGHRRSVKTSQGNLSDVGVWKTVFQRPRVANDRSLRGEPSHLGVGFTSVLKQIKEIEPPRAVRTGRM